MEYKILAEKLVFEGAILKLYQHTVQVPNGNIASWDAIHHPGAAAIVAIKKNGNLLLERQFRGAIGKYILEIPAGCKEELEEPVTCAARELEEETGYRPVTIHHLIDYLSAPAYTTEKVSIYYSEELEEGQLNWDEDEYLDLVEVPFEDALNMVRNGEIIDGKTVAALYAYADLKK